ncbi:MAG: efflux RND transporter permease subunit [Hyphomicrobium sp.]|nr:efflux RND transporter permease subunit [Hyphomicrobium sp.]
MWIVRYALAHRHSIGVLAILLLLTGTLSAQRMSTDILPAVKIPAINLIWTYPGLNAPEMASKISTFGEIAILNNVDNIRDVRSETLTGVAIIRVTFQPGTDVTAAFAQITSVSQTILRRMPPGTSPPLIVPFVPSSVPVLQLVLASDTLNASALFDYGRLQLRSQIQSIPGLRLTLPYGGASRQVMIDLKPEALQAYGVSPNEVARAINTQNLTLPTGVLRVESREIVVTTNASPETVAEFADLPLRSIDGRVVRVGDVASIRDGAAIQTNIARLDGQNAVIVAILKLGDASTVDIVRQVKDRLPELRASAPPGITIEPVFDQSVFVENAVDNVLKEAIVVAALVAFVVLVFLGSWRSSLIVLTSIPLALLASVAGLALTGQTFNLMTLGGLMLAIGILVDNALVEIENINRNLENGMRLNDAILRSAQEVAFPEFVSTLAICIVFSPLFLLTGTAAFIFIPLGLAVVFAMIASYVLSRTLVPSLAFLMLKEHDPAHPEQGHLVRLSRVVGRGLGAVERLLVAILKLFVRYKALPVAGLAAALSLGAFAAVNMGREFFPQADAGMIRVYLRTEPGSRLEETAAVFADVQRAVREIIPEAEVAFITENIGAPEAINLAWVQSGVIGSFDGEMLIQLKGGRGRTAEHAEAIRRMLQARFPKLTFYFVPADATAQTLAGSAQADFEIRLIGRDAGGNAEIARDLSEAIKQIPGASDVVTRQVRNLPAYNLEINRVRALQLGVTPQDAANAVLSTLGASGTVSPNFWADPAISASYTVQIVAPPARLTTTDQLLNIPVQPAAGGPTLPLRSIASLQIRQLPANIDRYMLQPTTTILANAAGYDIGSVYRGVEKAIAQVTPRLKPGNRIEVAGQAQSMTQAYAEMFGGIALAAVLVYLIMVVNFQSWLMPLIAMGTQPVAISGALFALWATGTPLSVPALTGIIMVIGVASANSVLVTSFARDRFKAGVDPVTAAIDAAETRLRPVMMTAIAMIVGIIPLALGLGDGGEQNAPLGRAVVGGLVFGTAATLTFVPVLFALLVKRRAAPPSHDRDVVATPAVTDAQETAGST